MKKGECNKCEKENWLEKHHIYPKSRFGENDETIYLCPNCHTDLHQKMGKPKSEDKKFYENFHIKWMLGIIVIIIIFTIINFI